MRETDQRPPGGRRAARHGAASPVSGARTSPARLARRLAPLAASVAVLALGLTFALAPQPEAVTAPTAATDTLTGDTQTVSVAADVAAPAVSHESYATTTGPETLVASGTNEDWAKLVLIDGRLAGHGGERHRHDALDAAGERRRQLVEPQQPAEQRAGFGRRERPRQLRTRSSARPSTAPAACAVLAATPPIDAALARGDAADATAQAIWASPWASSHYGNGTHWSSRPAEIDRGAGRRLGY